MFLLNTPITQSFDLKDLPEDPELKARTIMDYVDDLWRGSSSRAVISMEVHTAHWSRTLEMEGWSLEKDYSLVKITAPAKEAGTVTLKHKTDIYNYLPKTDRTIKITSGMMMGSWMGSHFTNDDLVKESRYAQDYVCRVTFDGERNGRRIWEMELIPKPEAAVVWGRILFTVDQETIMPDESRYFDEKNNLIRTMKFSDITDFSGRKAPATMKLTPADKPDEFTQLTYKSLQYNLDLNPDFFSLQNLKH